MLLEVPTVLTDPAGTNDLTHTIIGAAIRVHQECGPGLLESAYTELSTRYQLDLRIEGKVIVEVKSVAALAPIHTAQLITYLKLTGCPVGLLITST